MTTLREAIEKARENGHRDLADTMDLMCETSELFEVKASEQPVTGEKALYFRVGCILGVEYVKEIRGEAETEEREVLVQSLRRGGKRRLADAFDYCWSNRDKLENDDFDYTEMPIEGDLLFAFSIGISFGFAHERTEKA